MKQAHSEHHELIVRYQAKLLGHGALVLVIGLISGLMLIFSMLKGFVVWPIMDIPHELPGTVRGWKAAHVGGITNGLLIIVVALAMAKLPLTARAIKLVFWSLLATGWGNTLFYWGGNLSPNRGISFHANEYGETNFAGLIAFIGGGVPMLFTILALVILALAAFKKGAIR
ncbi:MAG: hypothetical protein ACI9FR_001568 [Cryomorphaceae bacterium]|jgi:hypothetical protein